MSFQTCMHFYLMWNLKEDILKNAGTSKSWFSPLTYKVFLSLLWKSVGTNNCFFPPKFLNISYTGLEGHEGDLNYEKCYIFGWTVPLMMNLFITNNSLECGYSWFIVLLLSAVLTAPIHCRGFIGEQVMLCWISPNLFQWRNTFIYILDEVESIFRKCLILGELFLWGHIYLSMAKCNHLNKNPRDKELCF